MKFSLLCCLLFALIGGTLHAQNTVLIQGVILNDSIDRANLNVVNVSMRRGTITNANGLFTIEVRLGDTLNISAVQYETQQIVIDTAMFQSRKVARYLLPKINELDPVAISNINLSGDMVADVKATEFVPHLSAAGLGLPSNKGTLPTVEERRLAVATGGPVGALLSGLSGRTALLKKHLGVSRLRNRVTRNREKYADSLFIHRMQIPAELIDDYLYFIFENKTTARETVGMNKLILLAFLIEQAPLYLELKAREKE